MDKEALKEERRRNPGLLTWGNRTSPTQPLAAGSFFCESVGFIVLISTIIIIIIILYCVYVCLSVGVQVPQQEYGRPRTTSGVSSPFPPWDLETELKSPGSCSAFTG